jgi:hypothetical protein
MNTAACTHTPSLQHFYLIRILPDEAARDAEDVQHIHEFSRHDEWIGSVSGEIYLNCGIRRKQEGKEKERKEERKKEKHKGGKERLIMKEREKPRE